MSWQGFFAMNGYGLYVWGSFGMCFALMAAEVVAVRLRSRRLHGLITQNNAAESPSFRTALPGSAR